MHIINGGARIHLCTCHLRARGRFKEALVEAAACAHGEEDVDKFVERWDLRPSTSFSPLREEAAEGV